VLVGLGALVAGYHTLQFLHILPFSLSPIRFFAFDLLGAFLWDLNAAILNWLVYSHWNLRVEGLLFVLVMDVSNLILAFLSVIVQSPFSAMLPAILINAIILIYFLMPNVEKAFKPVNQPMPAVTTLGAVRAPVAEAPAPAMPAMPVEQKMAPIPEQALAAAPPVAETNDPHLEEAPAEPEAAVVSALPMESKAAEVAVPAPIARHKKPVETIEGIGPVYAAKLNEQCKMVRRTPHRSEVQSWGNYVPVHNKEQRIHPQDWKGKLSDSKKAVYIPRKEAARPPQAVKSGI
jgi:hypothetical protein